MEKFKKAARQVASQDENAAFTPPEIPATPGAAFDPNAQVIYGASVHNLPLAGMTVAQARSAVNTILRVDHRAPALVNGAPVQGDYKIKTGDMLEFVHHAGEKGSEWTCALR